MSAIIVGASIHMLERFLEIENQCFKEEAFSKQHMRLLLTDYNSISLTATIDGEIAGFIIGRIDFVRNQPVGHIMTIDVSPNCQKRGIGAQLMIQMEELFKQRGAKESHLEVRDDNTAALSLYSKLGYKKIALLKNYYKKSHGFYLRKVLI